MVPRALTTAEIRTTVQDFARAAQNALEAGFDGVQILANYLYLIAQFLNSATNRRTDDYGGSFENRSRFMFEVLESVIEVAGNERTGIKLSPMHEVGPFAANEETLPMTEYAVRRLNDYDLSHLLLMSDTTDFSGTTLESLKGDGMFEHFRPIYRGTLIANVQMTGDRGNDLVRRGLADLIAFGRPFIANPDLVDRLKTASPLAEIDWGTVYGIGPEGYTDYPSAKPLEG